MVGPLDGDLLCRPDRVDLAFDEVNLTFPKSPNDDEIDPQHTNVDGLSADRVSGSAESSGACHGEDRTSAPVHGSTMRAGIDAA